MPLGQRSYERNGFNPTLRIVNNNQYSGHVNIIRLLALENHFLYLNVWLIIKLPQLPAQSFLLEKKPRRRNHLVLLRQYTLDSRSLHVLYLRRTFLGHTCTQSIFPKDIINLMKAGRNALKIRQQSRLQTLFSRS